MQNPKLSPKRDPNPQAIIVVIRRRKLTKFWRTLEEKLGNGCGTNGGDGLVRVELGVNGKPHPIWRMIL